MHQFKQIIDKAVDDPVKELIAPGLNDFNLWEYAVCYFDPKVFLSIKNELINFVQKHESKCHIQMWFIPDPGIDRALYKSYDSESLENEIIDNLIQFKNFLNNEETSSESKLINLLGWLIRDGILNLNFVYPKNNGLFHYKKGFFTNLETNRQVFFTGSLNWTSAAVVGNNLESISVFDNSQESFKEIVGNQYKIFKDQLSSNFNNSLHSLKITSKLAKELLDLPTSDKRPYDEFYNEFFVEKFQKDNNFSRIGDIDISENKILKIDTQKPTLPKGIELRKPQVELADKFQFRGIVSMCTGSGKTIAALNLLTNKIKNLKNGKSLLIVLLTPNPNLEKQWLEELKNFNFDPNKIVSSSNKDWQREIKKKKSLLEEQDYVVLNVGISQLTTNDENKNLKKIIDTYYKSHDENLEVFFIADEIHNYGAPKAMEELIKLKESKYYNKMNILGLSATPSRYMKEEENFLSDFFGEILIEYDIKQGIKDGILVEYDYYYYKNELTDDEEKKYDKLTNQIIVITSKIKNAKTKKDKFNLKLHRNDLYIRRSKIIKESTLKINQIFKIYDDLRNVCNNKINNTIFFTADSEQSNKVHNILFKEIGFKDLRQLNSVEGSNSVNNAILEDFKRQAYSILVCIDMLGEGIDIPNLTNLINISTDNNERKYIQRRGRVLRKAKDNSKTSANIFDIITFNNNGEPFPGEEERLKIFGDEARKKIKRF